MGGFFIPIQAKQLNITLSNLLFELKGQREIRMFEFLVRRLHFSILLELQRELVGSNKVHDQRDVKFVTFAARAVVWRDDFLI